MYVAEQLIVLWCIFFFTFSSYSSTGSRTTLRLTTLTNSCRHLGCELFPLLGVFHDRSWVAVEGSHVLTFLTIPFLSALPLTTLARLYCPLRAFWTANQMMSPMATFLWAAWSWFGPAYWLLAPFRTSLLLFRWSWMLLWTCFWLNEFGFWCNIYLFLTFVELSFVSLFNC